MIRWVFLDVGNILLDEDPVAYQCARIHWEAVQLVHPEISFLELIASREEFAMRGSRWALYEAVSAWIDEAARARAWDSAEQIIRGRFAELSPVVTGACELVARLSDQFRLGLIANQGRECREWLDRLGLLRRFEVVALSEEVGVAKPDLALFQRALDETGAAAGQCVMIGDRLDNDVAPAASLGMATIWVRWPSRACKGWRPIDAYALAYRDSLERTSARSPSRHLTSRPSLTVDRLGDLEPRTIAALRP